MFKKVKKSIKEPLVLLIRHGHTSLNNTSDTSQDRIRGWIDVPLNEQGRKDAADAADKVKQYKIDHIYSSDLSRAKETATIIQELDFPGVPIIYTMDLRPWNLGIYEGKLTEKVLEDLNKHVDNEDKVVPNGESFRSFKERYLGYVRNIVKDAVKNNHCVIITTHFRNLKTLDSWICNGAPADLEIDNKVMKTDTFKPGEIYEVNLKKVMMNV